MVCNARFCAKVFHSSAIQRNVTQTEVGWRFQPSNTQKKILGSPSQASINNNCPHCLHLGFFHCTSLQYMTKTIWSFILLTLAYNFISSQALTIKPTVTTKMATNGKKTVLNHISPDEVAVEIKDPVDPKALEQAKAILEELRSGKSNSSTGTVSSTKLLEIGKRLGDITADATKYVVSADDCKAAFDGLSEDHRTALVNIHARVKAFAEAQRATVKDMEMDIPGGKAGHTVSPCKGKTQQTYLDDNVLKIFKK